MCNVLLKMIYVLIVHALEVDLPVVFDTVYLRLNLVLDLLIASSSSLEPFLQSLFNGV